MIRLIRLLVLGTLSFLSLAPAFADPPNVIMILTDDHGYTDLGAYGIDKNVHTPNLDALAEGGALMTAGYCTAPQCVPSRVGLMTGQIQNEVGIGHNGSDAGAGDHTMPLVYPEGSPRAGQPVLTIADRLGQLGYVTGFSGKWHLGYGVEQDNPYAPWNRGFDEYWAGTMQNGPTNLTLDGERVPHRIERGLPDGVANRVIQQGLYAQAFIRRNADQPFFLYLSLFGPHIPLIDRNDPYYLNFPRLDYPHYIDWQDDRRRMGLALIHAVDDAVGGVVALLQELGIQDNTLILFAGDNGAPTKIGHGDTGLPHGEQNARGGIWNGSNNVPMRGEKGCLFEGGIRVPMLVHWPAQIEPGQVIDEMVTTLDLTATALVAARGERPEVFDGVDLLPRLTGEAETIQRTEPMFWEFWQTQVVREGGWKLWRGGGEVLLFNIAEDPFELMDLSAAHPEVVDWLSGLLDDWARTLPPCARPGPNASKAFAWPRHGAPQGVDADPRYLVPYEQPGATPYPAPIATPHAGRE